MKIAIASGKGGTGKTFVSTNLFYSALSQGVIVCIADCDAEEPNVSQCISSNIVAQDSIHSMIPIINTNNCVYCGLCAEYCNYNAIVCLPQQSYIHLVEGLCHSCGACLYACKYNAIQESSKLLGTISTSKVNNADVIEGRTEVGVFSPVPIIKKTIAKTDSYALSLLDSPPGISCPFIATVSNADAVLLVTEPTPFGLHDLQLSVETLREISKPFKVIINKSGLGNQDVYNWLQQEHIECIAQIPFDTNIAKIYSQGKILVQESEEYKELFASIVTNIMNSDIWK